MLLTNGKTEANLPTCYDNTQYDLIGISMPEPSDTLFNSKVKNLSVNAVVDGFSVSDDGPIFTPNKNILLVSSRQLADALIVELKKAAKSGGEKTPIYSFVCLSIDHTRPNRQILNRFAFEYAGNDLLYYRVDKPNELIDRQNQIWHPLIEWAESYLGSSFFVTRGVMPINQSEKTLKALKNKIYSLSDLEMTVLISIIKVSGSLITALAMLNQHISSIDAANVCLLDELFQMERWGADEITINKHKEIKRELDNAEALIELL
ncbi:MAG: ATP12 family protein [Pseudomonadota bacterium]|nr:ATP12 family protein [Pseudomonadota bacterium]